MRSISQIDFAIATGMFILLFALVVGTTSDYFTSIKDELKDSQQVSEAIRLLDSFSGFGLPANWYENASVETKVINASYARVFNALTNETKLVITDELKSYNDGNYVCISPANGQNAIEIQFNASLENNSIIGSAVFTITYNASAFERDNGKGDEKDDAYIFSTYFADWGGVASSEWQNWSHEIGKYIESAKGANAIRIYLFFVQSNATLCLDHASLKINWTSEDSFPRQIGLATWIYEVEVVANNTKHFYINQSANVTNLTNELVEVNLSQLGFSEIDVNSIIVLDENLNKIACNVSASVVRFAINLTANETRCFKIRFDDDSNYTKPFCNSSINGNNSIRERVYTLPRRKAIQLRKVHAMKNLDYLLLKRSHNVANDFALSLKNESSSFLEFGKSTPRISNVHCLKRYLTCQGEKFEMKPCELKICVW